MRAFGRAIEKWAAFPAGLIAALLAASPLFRAGYYDGHDGIAHLFRVVALADSIRRGIWYPRWADDLATGYGYPVFAFYAPGAHYLAWAVSLAGFDLATAVKLSYVIAFVAAAAGTYLLVREVLPEAGGFAAALGAGAYVFTPYVLDDVYVRGAFGEAVSFLAYPWLFLGVRLAAIGRVRAGITLSAVSAAVAVLTYNPLALVGVPLAGLYGLWLTVPGKPRTIAAPISGLALGMLLSAWFWLPAVANSGIVSLGNLGYTRENFLDPDQLVQWSLEYRHERFPFAVGLVQLLVLSAGTAAIFLRARGRWRELSFFPLVVALLLFLISKVSAPLWDAIPLLRFIAYPWRLLLFVACLGAVPAGALVLLVPKGLTTARAVVAVIGLAGLGSAALSPTLPAPIPLDSNDVNAATWLRREQDLGILGTTTSSEYLPVWASDGPGAAGAVPRAEGPRSVQSARIRRLSGQNMVLELDLLAKTNIRSHAFYFPGWSAALDGQGTSIGPTTALGLLTVRVPDGRHVLELSFGPTPDVTAGLVVSFVGLLVLAGLSVRLPIKRHSVVAVTVIPMMLVWPGPRLDGSLSFIPGGVEPLPGLMFLGAEIGQQDRRIDIRPYWLAATVQDRETPLTFDLVDENGLVAYRRTGPVRYGAEPMVEWRTNEIIADPFHVNVEESVDPGRYRARLGFAGSAPFDLGDIVITSWGNPSAPPRLATYGGQVALRYSTVTSNGKLLERHSEGGVPYQIVVPGQSLEFQLLWAALRVPDDDYIAFLHLYGRDERRWIQLDRRPGGNISALTTWGPGDTLLDRYQADVPLDIPAGEYRLDVGMYQPGGGPRLTLDPPGSGSAFAAERFVVTSRVPPPGRELNAPFGDWIRLDGLDLNRLSGSLRLVWRRTGPGPGSYSVFVHVIDGSGRIVAQSDGVPAAGAFPTEFWPAGAPMEDERKLTAPGSGPYRLRIGLYDPVSGQRLKSGSQEWVETDWQ